MVETGMSGHDRCLIESMHSSVAIVPSRCSCGRRTVLAYPYVAYGAIEAIPPLQ